MPLDCAHKVVDANAREHLINDPHVRIATRRLHQFDYGVRVSGLAVQYFLAELGVEIFDKALEVSHQQDERSTVDCVNLFGPADPRIGDERIDNVGNLGQSAARLFGSRLSLVELGYCRVRLKKLVDITEALGEIV